jgi:hypothetical protein
MAANRALESSREQKLEGASETWGDDTDVIDVSLQERTIMVERVAELHLRRVQAGLLAVTHFPARRLPLR